MAKLLVLNRWEDKFLPGSASDSQLFHADTSDQILVCSPLFGQGYIQKILLEDDLTLIIHDYTFNQDLVRDTRETSKHLKFEFQIAGANAGYSMVAPSFGLKRFDVISAQKRSFEIEIIFQKSSLIKYLQAFTERLPPQIYSDAESVLQSIYRYQGGRSIATMAGMLNQIFRVGNNSDPDETFEQVLADVSAGISLLQAARYRITSAMEQVIGQVLSCPYQGTIRRPYLKRKALELVSLYLEAMVQSTLNEADLDSIYQAASILRTKIVNPPSVEALARQVSTNRLKLNQGFHQVYGATPFSYLRECRLLQARRLLMTSDLSVERIAAAVGYSSRNHFAKAFRREAGLNPKAFQMQAWQCAR